MFWLWLGWRRLEKPPPTSLKHFLHSLWKTRKCVLTPSQKNNSLKLFMDTFHITQHHHVRCPCVHKTCRYFQPAVVLLVNDSIPTSGICNDWSAKENCINTDNWQLMILTLSQLWQWDDLPVFYNMFDYGFFGMINLFSAMLKLGIWL